jgi:hypothetical protein
VTLFYHGYFVHFLSKFSVKRIKKFLKKQSLAALRMVPQKGIKYSVTKMLMMLVMIREEICYITAWFWKTGYQRYCHCIELQQTHTYRAQPSYGQGSISLSDTCWWTDMCVRSLHFALKLFLHISQMYSAKKEYETKHRVHISF